MITYINPDAIEDQSIDWSKLKNVPEFPSGGGSDTSTPPMIEVTYGELKELRDNAELVPGQQYRITDYVTTTAQENTISANHQFDIIVTADSENVLNEKARACLHEGDTYFASSDLTAWEIWYCLDNDTNRFAWASTLEADAVISEPKIIGTINSSSFTLSTTNSTGQTFIFDKLISYIVFDGTTYTLSQIEGSTGLHLPIGPPIYVRATSATSLNIYSTSSVSTTFFDAYPIEVYTEESIIRYAGKGLIYRMIDESGNDCPYDFKNIMFKHPKDTTTYPDYYYTFTVLNSGVISDHSLDNGRCCNNVMKERITLIASGIYGISLNKNVFINTSNAAICYYNTFGNNCYNNTFGEGSRNTFGNNCSDNDFGNNCSDNTFGNTCYRNTFGNNCNNNSFGNNCHDNSFRLSASTTATLLNYCHDNTFDNGCKYIVIWNSTQPTISNELKNIKVDASASNVYYNVTTLNSANPIFISKEYNTSTLTTSIPIGLYNTNTAINNKVYTASVTVTPSKNCINAAGGFYETSDERLKNFSDDVTIDLEKLSSLRKKYFTWKDGHGDQQLGVSAQEVQVLYPELVNEGDDGHLSVDYAKLSVVALKAIDTLHDKNTELEKRITDLEKVVDVLLTRVC